MLSLLVLVSATVTLSHTFNNTWAALSTNTLGVWLTLYLALCLGLAWAYEQCFALKQQQRKDQALVQSLAPASTLDPNLNPTAQLYHLHTEHLKLGMVAGFMLTQDTQRIQQALQGLSKRHEDIQNTCTQQQHKLATLAKQSTQQIQNTKNNLENCTKSLRDHSDIQSHLQACRHQLGQFNQFAFECKQTVAVLHRHRHNQNEQASPALQHQQQQLLIQLEQLQEHTQYMLAHMHQAQVGLNALEKQQTELYMALQQHQELALRSEKASVSLQMDNSQWEEHLKQSHHTLQHSISTLRQTEALATTLDHRIKGKTP